MSNWITAFTPSSTQRTDSIAWAGQKFTVGSSSVTVTGLGIWVLAGTAGATHTVKLVLASSGADVAGASVSINTASSTAGAFKYVSFSSPVTLSASTAYYLVASEPGGGELWLSYDSVMTVAAVAAASGAVYNTSASGGTWTESGVAGQNYVGLDFQYSAGADTTPPTMVSAVVNGSTLTATASEALDPAFVPATSAFIVTVNGSGRGVTNVAVSGSTVTLTLASPVTSGQTVTLGYNP